MTTIPRPYKVTGSGRTVDLLRPRPDEMVLRDMALSIAYTNRFDGHVGTYSVAQHCVLGALQLRAEGHSAGIQRAFLLHDLHEAHTGDVSSPVKRCLGEVWREFELPHMEAVERRFQTRFIGVPAVGKCDARMCVTEAIQLLGGYGPLVGDGWPDVEPYPIRITRWRPELAFEKYMREARRLDVR